MKPGEIAMGEASSFELRTAILVYTGTMGSSFATVHDVQSGAKQRPALGPGRLATMSFLAELARGLGSNLAPEILPSNVIARTPHMICWWTPAKTRVMYFRKESEMGRLDAKNFPIPALVWRLSGRELHMRALDRDGRPDARTELYIAPFWNTNDVGLVCQGSMKHPEEMSVATLDQWADGYFNSEFTHAFGVNHHTTHKKGFVGLWSELAGSEVFPPEYLLPAKETLAEFVQGKDA